VSKFRLLQLQRLQLLAVKSKARDDEIKAAVAPELLRILAPRNLGLLEALIKEVGYPDTGLVLDIARGFRLTGIVPRSFVFHNKIRAASMTAAQLKASGKWSRKALCAKIRASDDPALDDAVWSETQRELAMGWLTGPLALSEVSAAVGSEDWVVSRRFGIQQSGKVRVIDDFSESGVNSTSTVLEKVSLDSVDDFFCALKLAAQSVDEGGGVKVVLSDGSALVGRLPHGVSRADALTWHGKTADLKSAYRQVGTSADERWATVIGVFSPVRKAPVFYLQHGLPFGAVSSVANFNRLSRCLWALGAVLMRYAWTSFFDDYPIAEPAASASMCDLSIKAFFNVLGWLLSLEPKKWAPFRPVFVMLGVVAELEHMPAGKLLCSNKPERAESLASDLRGHLESGKLPQAEAGVIRGKLQFAANQLFGRRALAPLAALARHQYGSRTQFISEQTRAHLHVLLSLLMDSRPRVMECFTCPAPVLIFTDAACEGSDGLGVSLGAVCFDPALQKSWVFGARVPEALVRVWQEGDDQNDSQPTNTKRQTIGQAEMLPVILARMKFQALLTGRRVIYFIDNDSARMVFVKGTSGCTCSQRMADLMVMDEGPYQTFAWFARVPTLSNPADGPSRLRLKPSAENLFSECVDCPVIDVAYFSPVCLG
jgi:hypothetical protein